MKKKEYRYLKRSIDLVKVDLFFDDNRRYDRLPLMYNIKRKCRKYLNNNRNIYKMYKFKKKQKYNFIKKHIKAISPLSIKSRVHMFEYSIRNVIIKLKYAYTYKNSNIFIKCGFVFLNGKQEFNQLKFMYKGDYLELIFSNYIIKLRYKISKKLKNSMFKYKRYNWKSLKNKVESSTRNIRLSRFSLKLLHYRDKISNIFQFDYRTLTFILIDEIEPKKDLSYLNKKILPIYLLKLFNWKLIS